MNEDDLKIRLDKVIELLGKLVDMNSLATMPPIMIDETADVDNWKTGLPIFYKKEINGKGK